MDVPIYVKLDSEDGIDALVALIRFANEECNRIAERAWQQRAFDRPLIEELVEDELRQRRLHHSLVQTLTDRVADAFARNGARYAPTFDARDSLLLRENSGVIEFDPELFIGPVSIRTPDEGQIVFHAALEDLFPPQWALLEHRTGDYGLVLDFGDDDDGTNTHACFLGVLCRPTTSAARAYRMVGWMPQAATRQQPDQPPEPPAALDELIPSDHPLRDFVSPLELKESPFFSVKALATVMGVPVQKLYQRCERKEIACVRDGVAVKIPRAEFSRLATLALSRTGAKEEVLAAAAELEKTARRLRQAMESGA